MLFRSLACDWGIIDSVPKVKRMRVQVPRTDFLEIEQLELLISASIKVGYPCCPAVLLAARTGMRRGELRGLRWEDVDFRRRIIDVRQAADDECVMHPPKSGLPRTIPMTDDLFRELNNTPRLGELVLCQGSGSCLTDKMIAVQLRKACELAGVGCTWHVLRHSFASHLSMEGVPISVVKELLGHATIGMTMRYTHLSSVAKKNAIDVLSKTASIGVDKTKKGA